MIARWPALLPPELCLPRRLEFPVLPVFTPEDDAGAGAPLSSARVLVVEDDYIVAMESEYALLDAGFTVVGIAASADEAIALARSEKPDLALMDVRLAGSRDGVDAALQIFAETGVRCIFATAHGDSGTRHRARPAQPLGWVSKPYTAKALVDAVRAGLAHLRKR